MQARSLSVRIIAMSGAWVLFTLIIAAILLVFSYRDHAAQHYDEHVSMHLEELIEASEILPNGSFQLVYQPSDPRYEDLHSGWYWEVRQSGESLARSPSLGEFYLHDPNILPTDEVVVHEIAGPMEDDLRLHVVELPQGLQHKPLVYLSSAPSAGFTGGVRNYSTHIFGSFLLLGIGLLLAVVLQVRIALKPLQAISSGITDIREGKITKLPASNLEEVQPLIAELNNLLNHNSVLLKRARNQLGDLAHSVKNPLAVINNEAKTLPAEQGGLILRQTRDISRNVDHYLSRARTFGAENVLGARSEVKPVVEDLVFAMQRIYQQRNLNFELSQIQDCWFRGEAQDLEEILGNLMDNACKWTDSCVSLSVKVNGDRLSIIVEDDGPGIPESESESVMRRGHKLDETKAGHGQGLGIVNDMVELYGGKLALGSGKLGGLLVSLELPAA